MEQSIRTIAGVAAPTLMLLMVPSCRTAPTQEETSAQQYFEALKQNYYPISVAEARDKLQYQNIVTGISNGEGTNIVLQWEPEDLPYLTVNRDKGELLYDGRVILQWAAQKHQILGMPGYAAEDVVNAVPLSYPAIIAHPLHKSHPYKTLQDFSWLENFHPAGSMSEEILETYKPGYGPKTVENYDPAEWKRLNEIRKNSVEYAVAAYGHAVESLQTILKTGSEIRGTDKKEKATQYAVLMARAAIRESGEGSLPGPNQYVVNSKSAAGYFQFLIAGLTASDLLVQDTVSGDWCWTNKEVAGKPMNGFTDFLNSPDAQIYAMDCLIRANQRDLDAYIQQGYDTSGAIMAAHLVGIKEVKKMFDKYSPEQLAVMDPKDYPDIKSDSYNTSALDYYQRFSGILSAQSIELTRRQQSSFGLNF